MADHEADRREPGQRTGVSEPVVQTQGTDRSSSSSPASATRRRSASSSAQTGRLDFVPLPVERYGSGTDPGPTPQPRAAAADRGALFSAATRSSRPASTDQNGARPSTSCSRARAASSSPTTRPARRRLLRDRPRRLRRSRRRSSRARSRAARSRSRRRHSAASPRRRCQQPRHGPAVTAPCRSRSRSSLQRQISATLGRQFLNQSLLAGAIGDPLVFIVHAALLPAARPGRQLRARSTTRSWCSRSSGCPGDADPGRHRGLRALGRHGGRRQHPHLRADEGGAAARQVAARRRRGRLQPGLELDPRLERVEPDHGDDPLPLRVVGRSAASRSS